MGSAALTRFEAFDIALTRRGPFRPGGLLDHAAHLRADPRGIFVDGERVIAAEAIRGAYAQPGGEGRVAVVVDAGNTLLELKLKDASHAGALLRAIGFGALQRAARFAGISVEDESESVIGRFGAAAILVAGGAAGVSALLGSGLLVLPLVVGVFVLAVVHATRSVGITVGADGLAYERFGLAPRFVPYARIQELSAESDSATLTLDTGERIALRFDLRGGGDHEGGAMVARLREVLDHHKRARPSEPALESMRELGRVADETGASYREAAVPADVLWEIVEDPTSPSHTRVQAAAALRPALDDHGKERLRVAAEACASPRLRIALDALADDDEEHARQYTSRRGQGGGQAG